MLSFTDHETIDPPSKLVTLGRSCDHIAVWMDPPPKEEPHRTWWLIGSSSQAWRVGSWRGKCLRQHAWWFKECEGEGEGVQGEGWLVAYHKHSVQCNTHAQSLLIYTQNNWYTDSITERYCFFEDSLEDFFCVVGRFNDAKLTFLEVSTLFCLLIQLQCGLSTRGNALGLATKYHSTSHTIPQLYNQAAID